MKREIKDFVINHANTITYVVLFLVVGIMFLTIGFWKTTLLILLVGLGYFIGNSIDKKKNPSERVLLFILKIKDAFKKL